ncbi:MAG TPA: flagellar hook-basal body complex protein [Firmicutes bacterium]|nr:flagellar hook-basal body complex protein [Bacillota bacterium]
MLGSLYSGVTGMRVHQQKLNVIGNNIANVNTIGFKKDRVVFQETFARTLQAAYEPAGNRGGVNPMQVGTGVALSSIDTIHEQGDLASTGRMLDLAIQGEGYFIVAQPNGVVYTRAGSFDIDAAGNLINPATGGFVQGWNAVGGVIDTSGAPTNITIDPRHLGLGGGSASERLEQLTIDDRGRLIGVLADNTPIILGQVALAMFPNPAGLNKVGGTSFSQSLNSGAPQVGEPQTGGRGRIIPENLEMSNVDLVQEFTEMITTQRGFQANSRVITTSDELLQETLNIKR